MDRASVAAQTEYETLAAEDLAWRIKSGKERVGIAELLDSELDHGPKCQVFGEIVSLLVSEEIDLHSQRDQIVDGLIQRYLRTKPEEIAARASRIQRDVEDTRKVEEVLG